MKVIGLWVLLTFTLLGCSDRRRIQITNEYIINENWSKKNEQVNANSITIIRMKVKKDSTIESLADLSQAEILIKFEEDSSFMHYATIKIKAEETYKNKKIYFNHDNGFYWGTQSRHNSNDTTKVIGLLQPGNWYRFSDLGLLANPYYIYIYIDSANKAHRFDINLSNY